MAAGSTTVDLALARADLALARTDLALADLAPARANSAAGCVVAVEAVTPRWKASADPGV